MRVNDGTLKSGWVVVETCNCVVRVLSTLFRPTIYGFQIIRTMRVARRKIKR